MVNLVIDSIPVSVEPGTSILDAARRCQIDIPTLCYLKDYDSIGACRMCVVEVEGQNRLEAACNTPVREGMVVHTQSERVQKAREINLKLIDARHHRDCPNCKREGSCGLQKLFLSYDIPKDAYEKKLARGKRAQWIANSIVQKDHNKCVLCGRCVEVCKKTPTARIWDFVNSGSRTQISVPQGRSMFEAGCIACGQCITHCPTAALTERDDCQRLRDAIADPRITTVVQIAPAVRTAWASSLGVPDGELSVERICAALHALGVDYVFDTVLSADLTIMEEGSELISRLQQKDAVLPLFTSCCPGWTAHVRNKHPELLDNLSSAKSPMMMFGAVIKSWFAQKINTQPDHIFSVAIMPCTAKKGEIMLAGGKSNENIPDMDASITTREFMRMVDRAGIDVLSLEDEALDDPLQEGTGAGVIFGTTGGVMEAALRSAHFLVTGSNPDPKAFTFKPHPGGWREAHFALGSTSLRCAVADGINNAEALITAVQEGSVEYDFIEVMACPSGCAGGGGQPIDGTDREQGLNRGQVLLKLDNQALPVRFSHENTAVQQIYTDWLDAPLSEKAHHYLHVDHHRIKREQDAYKVH